VPVFRFDAGLRASQILRALPSGAPFEAYEVELEGAFGDLVPFRERLYSDLEEYRRLAAFDPVDAPGLLDRYNLAQVQGLLFFADRITIEADEPDLLEVRRLLRHLKFCRLVAELSRHEGTWTLTVDGPGAVASMSKKYGLHLASFFSMVPILSRYTMTATVRPPHRGEAALVVSHEDGLVATDLRPSGFIPEEIAAFASDLEGWTVDPAPDVRNVGVSDVAVADFTLHRSDVTVAVELFHRWHRGPLERRLIALEVKPDPFLVLGVDRALLDGELRSRVETSDQVFVFSDVPSKRALAKVLSRYD
jgi:predicted nuclease of restriction endonuclease-like RecB superfamily